MQTTSQSGSAHVEISRCAFDGEAAGALSMRLVHTCPSADPRVTMVAGDALKRFSTEICLIRSLCPRMVSVLCRLSCTSSSLGASPPYANFFTAETSSEMREILSSIAHTCDTLETSDSSQLSASEKPAGSK